MLSHCSAPTELQLSLCKLAIYKTHGVYVICYCSLCSHLLPFALLLCDITRASSLAEMVLKSHTVSEVRANISQSMAMLGPVITLDTITEMLFIGMGSLAGARNI